MTAAPRAMLFATFGVQRRPRHCSWAIEAYAKEHARLWWIVEATSAAEARQFIAEHENAVRNIKRTIPGSEEHRSLADSTKVTASGGGIAAGPTQGRPMCS